jgi:hypothetical protein
MRWLLLLLTILWGVRPAVADDRLELSVYSTQGTPTLSAAVGSSWVSVPLTASGDDIYRAQLLHPPGRLMDLSLSVPDGPVTEDLLVLATGTQRVFWVVDASGHFLRANAPMSQGRLSTAESLALIRGGAWIVIIALLIVSGRLRSDGDIPQWRMSDGQWFLVWLLLAVAWTWPAVLSSDTVITSLHFDGPGTLWVMGVSSKIMTGLDTLSAWPMGADLSRLDSYLMVPISALLSMLSPGRLFGLFSVVGVALSALAAQQFARVVGARSPWTALAGLGFGFSGMAATALLEGHIYQIFNPWLPWFGAALWRATSPQSKDRQAWLAVFLFALCWLTSAYVGVMALGLAVVIIMFSSRRRWGLVAGMGAVILTYAFWYTRGTAIAREALGGFNPVSSHLASWLAATPEMDRMEHAVGPVLYGWMLGLVLLAGATLGRGRWRALALAGVGGAVLSLFPGFAASPELVLLPINLDWISGPISGMLRFPLRFAWLWSLCGGVVAALVATRLAPRWGRLGHLILFVALAEAFIRVAPLHRTEQRYISAPTSIGQSTGAVLELLPFVADNGADRQRWMAASSCIEQLAHNRGIAEDCLHARPRQLRARLNAWLQDRLHRKDTTGVSDTLSSLGFSQILLRSNRFTEAQTARLTSALERIDSKPISVAEAGVYGRLFKVRSKVKRDVTAGLSQLNTPLQPQVFRRSWTNPVHHGRFNGRVALGTVATIAFALGFAMRRRWGA